jgi:DNA gyrase subunit B
LRRLALSLESKGIPADALVGTDAPWGELVDGNERQPVHSLIGLLEAVRVKGRKGLTIQRYKGLGEMNPEQLFETTMDPDNRKLLRVVLEDVVKADHMFTVLMGDEVEPRRNFIQDNALNVRNLDV